MDKKRFLTSAPRGRGATPYIETSNIKSLKVSKEVAELRR